MLGALVRDARVPEYRRKAGPIETNEAVKKEQAEAAKAEVR